MSLWNCFNDIWTPSGRQFNFQPFEQQTLQQEETSQKSQQLSNQISQIKQSIENKQKILEETYLPKKIRSITTHVQIKEAPQIKSLSVLKYKQTETRSQTSRTQSATPIMRRSKKHQKPIEIKDTIGLQIEKCLLSIRYPQVKTKLDYTFVPRRRQKSNIESSSYNYNKVEYKHSITLAKWDQSERSVEIF
ncbi:unnamed protein product [Paramecium pentaurelia]|uniref:Uncharacterized protein n=1 Tax=Paramecium pentaurelia TaxID=43138 RepID=A0A8S1Y6F2_9CILI|nr:unnamed protein product [Paramecium pentaurelia]